MFLGVRDFSRASCQATDLQLSTDVKLLAGSDIRLTRDYPETHNRAMPHEIKPTTISRHAFGVYPSIAMLAGMQLDVFTPLTDGPMTVAELASALSLSTQKLSRLLYALVHAGLLQLQGDRFANTPEADVYLVRGRPTYLGE
jgi:hypothetical protein